MTVRVQCLNCRVTRHPLTHICSPALPQIWNPDTNNDYSPQDFEGEEEEEGGIGLHSRVSSILM